MAPRLSVLVDLNVILDVLARREPHFASSAAAWAQIETGAVEGFVAAHSVTTLFYLLSRHTERHVAVRSLRELLSVFAVAAVDHASVEEALDLGWTDFEDAVQMTVAARVGVDYLVTRNTRDFRGGRVRAITPAELLAMLEATRDCADESAS